MPKKKKEALTWVDTAAMQKLLDKKQYATFADVHYTLSSMYSEGMQLGDDWIQCLLYPFKLWGSDAVTRLDEMRQQRDEAITTSKFVKATEVGVMEGVTGEDAAELIKSRDFNVLRECVNVLRSELIGELDDGQQEFLDLAEHYLLNRR